MPRDVDQIIDQVKARVPNVRVRQLQGKYPGADDDGIWFFGIPGHEDWLQIESSFGQCPFIIEHDGMKSSEALIAKSVEETAEQVVAKLLGLGRP